MGEQEDTDPNKGTDPGIGPPTGASAKPSGQDAENGPAPVDFDALHAALGDPLDLEDVDAEEQTGRIGVGESSGQSSAAYASTRPHTIPPTRPTTEDLNAPAVILADEVLAPAPSPAPLNVTVPMAPPIATPPPQPVALAAQPISSGQHLAAAPARAPHATPAPFPMHQRSMTQQMPNRPIGQPPKRRRAETIVVRKRGPSRGKQLLVFLGLILAMALGAGLVIWQRPGWVGLDSVLPVPASAWPPPAPLPADSAVAPPVAAPPGAAVSGAGAPGLAGGSPGVAASGAAGPVAPATAPSASAAPVPSASAAPRKRPPAAPLPVPPPATR